MAKTRRVVFSFDERSLESLEKLTEQGRFSSMADMVRESCQDRKNFCQEGPNDAAVKLTLLTTWTESVRHDGATVRKPVLPSGVTAWADVTGQDEVAAGGLMVAEVDVLDKDVAAVKADARFLVLHEESKGHEPLKVADYAKLTAFLAANGVEAKDHGAALGAGLETPAKKCERLIDWLKTK